MGPAIDNSSRSVAVTVASSAPLERQRASGEYVAGDVIDSRFRLQELLGSGGMGSVWAAHHEGLDVPVAVKLIRGGAQDCQQGLAERFALEARLAARLEHESVIKVFDFGRSDRGDPFLVMELLRGEDLGDALRRTGPMDPDRAVRLLLPVIEALVAAHQQHIVHRDLKPDNIFLAEVGGGTIPKVLDFGIARSCGMQGAARLTRAGACVGSPEYMAPEQAAGMDDVDARADIWALCVVLYECVAGRVPFPMEDRSYERLLRDILETELPTFAQVGVAEEKLWKIVARGLSKDRSLRYQTVAELGGALAAWLLDRGVTEDIRGRSIAAQWSAHRPRSSRAALLRFGQSLKQPAIAWPIGLALLATGHLAWSRAGAVEVPHPTRIEATLDPAPADTRPDRTVAAADLHVVQEDAVVAPFPSSTPAPRAVPEVAKRATRSPMERPSQPPPHQAAPSRPAEAASSSGQRQAAAASTSRDRSSKGDTRSSARRFYRNLGF